MHDYGRDHVHDRGRDDDHGRDDDMVVTMMVMMTATMAMMVMMMFMMMFAMAVVMGIFVFHIFIHNKPPRGLHRPTVNNKKTYSIFILFFKSTILVGFKSYLLNMF